MTETLSRIRASFQPSRHRDRRDVKISGYGRDVVQNPTPTSSGPTAAVTACSQPVQSSPNPRTTLTALRPRKPPLPQASHAPFAVAIGPSPAKKSAPAMTGWRRPDGIGCITMSDEPSTPKLQVQIDEDVAQGVYSNLVLLNHTENEFVLDFAFIQPSNGRAKVRS